MTLEPMLRLTLLLHAIAASVLSGVGIVGVLVAGLVSGKAIAAAILAGILLGWPVARLVAKKLLEA